MVSQLLPAGYAWPYVAASIVVSAVGAFVALTAAAGIIHAGRPVNRINLFAAGVALGGIGIWAMHFIGMLALRIDMGVGYSMVETLLSLAIAVGGSMVALSWVARHPGSLPHLLGAGAIFALAVCVMHYLGMYGMRFGGEFRWSPQLVAASVAIACVAATAALWLAFALRGIPARAAAAVVMAVAVGSMHYTGMAAADFICTTATPNAVPRGFGVVSSMDLPALVIVVALGMAFIIAVDQFFQRVGTVLVQPARRRA